MGYQFIHPKTTSLPLSNGGANHYQIYDIYQISNFSQTWTNKNNAYISKNKYITKIEIFENNLLYQRILLQGFTLLIHLLLLRCMKCNKLLTDIVPKIQESTLALHSKKPSATILHPPILSPCFIYIQH